MKYFPPESDDLEILKNNTYELQQKHNDEFVLMINEYVHRLHFK